ncbi:hypothetical protein MuYL_2201 [Mucilaginibacter xinganensis]|uniref:Uncharacterized protein n=1 Tax=Mucilaginibacter xinganensis TaxID=1234841 RepID=A0A223NX13_9SPHI|nr:hypothetical protein MuYL_2201 [Mucilaginibacter xinganensis]
MAQNPAYRFAADMPLSVKREGLFIFVSLGKYARPLTCFKKYSS